MLVLLSICCAAARAAALPEAAAMELKRLEEAYRVLDFAAEKVWTGWNGYRKVPFLMEFENGLRLLVGHPNPPKPFQAVAGAAVAERAVFADFSAVNPKVLAQPLAGGGGPIPFGADASGQQVQVVHMRYRSGQASPSWDSERQISVIIHELFHCFQRERLRGPMYGNLRYNADVNYAVYSEIEGLALGRAYAESDAGRAREYLRDFLAARRKKRAGSMTAQQGNQENFDEFNEGTATYSELRAFEVIKGGGFEPRLKDDPHYRGFGNVDELLSWFPEELNRSAGRTEDPRSKSYFYGCFEAALLERYFPGWQESVPGKVDSLERELSRRLAVPEEDWPKLEQRLEETYPWAEIRQRHAPVIVARDEAWRTVRGRTGRVYVIDVKKTGHSVGGLRARGKSQRLGLVAMFPEGFEAYRFDEVEIGGTAAPAEVDQLYYVRVVDTEVREGAPYAVEGARQPDGTWKQAVVRTPLFTVKAPHVRVLEAPTLVKVQVLSRVSR
jgi:hypothetical protein